MTAPIASSIRADNSLGSAIIPNIFHCVQIVRYGCDYGYIVDGRSWQVCVGSDGPIGGWTDQVPSCRGKDFYL